MSQKISNNIQSLSIKELEIVATQQEPQTKKSIFSQYTEFYLEYLGQPKSGKNYKRFAQQFLKHSIIYTSAFAHRLQITTIETDFQSLRILLHYGNYKKEITIIYTQLENSYFPTQLFAKGSFGSIYSLNSNGRNVAVKKITFLQKGTKFYKNKLYLLASAMEVGPQVVKTFGYDIIITKNSAFFSMEMCEEIQNTVNLEQIMKQNLLKMHQIKMVHLDIKPQNIAYSNKYKKYVYLDFGLSQLIQQQIGTKSSVNFTGTLAYCSQQMKKCYMLTQRLYIDLYYNDICGLKKSLVKYNASNYQPLKFNKTDEKNQDQITLNEYQQNSINFQINILQDSIYIFLIKYYLFAKMQAQLLHLIKKYYKKMPKCTNEIINKQRFFLKSKQHQQIRVDIKQYLIKQNFQTSNSDQYLSITLCGGRNLETFSQILPIYQIISSMQHQSFQNYLLNIDEIFKLFTFIDPFSYQNQKDLRFFDQNNIRKRLIQKIYQTLNQNYSSDNNLAIKNTHFVLIFLYQKLKNLKNYRVLTSLRLLFICIQGYDIIQQIEQQILQIVTSIQLKMLKLIQFELFANICQIGFDYPSKIKRIQLIQKIQLNQSNQKQTNKLKQLALIIYKSEHFLVSQWKQRQNILKRIQQIQQESNTQQYRQLITNIKYLYHEKSKTNSNISPSLPNILSLKIYALRFEYYNFIQLKQQKQYLLCILKVFPSIQSQLYYIQHQQNKFHIFCKILSYVYQGDLNSFVNLGKIVTKRKQVQDLLNKQILFNYAERSTNLILQTQITFENKLNQCFCCFYTTHYIAHILKKRAKFSEIEIHKIYDSMKKIHTYLQNQQPYNGKNAQYFKVMSKSIQLVIFSQFLNKKQITHKITQIVQAAHPFPYKDPNLACALLQVFMQHRDQLYKKQNLKLQDAYVNICQSYIRSGHLYVFQKCIYSLYSLIQIKNSRNKFQDVLDLLLIYINHLIQNSYIFIHNYYIYTLSLAIQKFCQASPIQFLSNKYKQLSCQKFQFQYSEYSYLIFCIFCRIHHNFIKNAILKQLRRTCLSFSNMKNYLYIKSYYNVYRIARKTQIIKNKRKNIICLKKQCNSILSKKFQRFVSFFNCEAKIKIKNSIIMAQLSKKIQRL